VDGALGKLDASPCLCPGAATMIGQLRGAIAGVRRVGRRHTQSGLEQHRARKCSWIPVVSPRFTAFSTIMACATSMIGAIEAAGMIDGIDRDLALVGGVESMSRCSWPGPIPLRLAPKVSAGAVSRAEGVAPGEPEARRSSAPHPIRDNRTDGKSMGEAYGDQQRERNLAYRMKVLRGEDFAYLIAAWVNQEDPDREKILADAMSRVELDTPKTVPAAEMLSAREKRGERLAFNGIGMVYFNEQRFEQSAPFFQKSVRSGRVANEYALFAKFYRSLHSHWRVSNGVG